MRRLVRFTAQMAITIAVLGVVLRIRRTVLGRLSGVPGDGDTIRTGSFDRWPPVPPAPGRGRPGG